MPLTNNKVKGAGSGGTRIATATTTTLRTGAGVLRSISVGLIASCSIAVYDNTAGSGTLIHGITVPPLGQPFTLLYDRTFDTGLTLVTTGGTLDVHVTWDPLP